MAATQTVVIKHQKSRRPLPLPLALPAAIIRCVAMLLGGLLLPAAFVIIREAVVGKRRRAIVPAWFAGLAAVSVRDVWVAWLLAAASLAGLSVLADIKGRTRVLSVREMRLWAAGCAAVTVWQATRSVVPWPVEYGLLAALTVAVAVPWWLGGRAAGIMPKREAPQETAWREQVSDHPAATPDLKESRLVVDREQRSKDVTTGVLHLKPGVKASSAAVHDEHVESLLDVPRGTITMGTAPGLTSRQLRVVFSRQGTTDVIRYWDGPSLNDAGFYVVGCTNSGDKITDRMWHETGGSFATILAGPRLGKGVRVRIEAIESGLSERVWLAAIDGKSGAGFPEIRDACDLYVGHEGVTAWRKVIAGVDAIYRTRAARYGREGRSLFKPRDGEPVITLLIDEGLRVMTEVGARHVQMIEDMTGGGSSIGIRIVLDAQKGDARSMGTTTIRANLRANGSVWIGPTGDQQARIVAVQDWEGIDPGLLPSAKGWAWQASRPQGVEPTQIRTLYLPSRIEVDELGVEAPFGVAEEWAAKSAHPVLHPDDQAALDAVLGEDATDGTPRLTVVQPTQTETGRDRIRRILAEADGPMERGEIAKRAQVVPRHATDLLNDLEAAGEARRTDGGWEKAS